MERHTDIERIRSLVIETFGLIAAYKDSSERIVNDVRHRSDESSSEQRCIIVQVIREETADETSQIVHSYVEDMEETHNRMRRRVREFNSRPRRVQQENSKISPRSVLIVPPTLATLVAGGIVLFWFHANVLQSKKLDADMITRID